MQELRHPLRGRRRDDARQSSRLRLRRSFLGEGHTRLRRSAQVLDAVKHHAQARKVRVIFADMRGQLFVDHLQLHELEVLLRQLPPDRLRVVVEFELGRLAGGVVPARGERRLQPV